MKKIFSQKNAINIPVGLHQAFFVTVICLLLVFARHPDQFFHPQFWIEDRDLYFYSSWSNLFDSVNGYLCLVKRILVTLFVSTIFIPAEYHPTIAFVLAIISLASILFYFQITPSRLPKPSLFALAIVLSPHYGSEVFAKFLYLIWILPLSVVFLLFRDPRNLSRIIIYIDIFLLILAGFSGPLVVILLPVLLYVTFIYRNSYYLKLSLVAIACSIIQVSYLVNQPQKAISSDVNNQTIFQILETFIRNFCPQYLFPGQIAELFTGWIYLIILIGLVASLSKRYRLDASILGIVFVSSAIPPILKLYPNSSLLLDPVITGSARYFFYPFIAITFYLLLVSIKGKPWGRFIAIAVLIVSFLYNLPGFQTTSFDYRWADHIKYARQNNCNAKIPISFAGKEGFAWVYESDVRNPVVCSDYEISNWKDKTGNNSIVQEDGRIILKNNLRRAVFSPINKIRAKNNTFVNFSPVIAIGAGQKVKVGFVFLDSQSRTIKITADTVFDNGIPTNYSYTANIPSGTEFIEPYIHLISNSSAVTISKPSILLFK